MNRLGYADRDGAGWRTRARRRADDSRFLMAVRAVKTLDEVRALREAQRKPMPEWKQVALMRAIKRVCLEK